MNPTLLHQTSFNPPRHLMNTKTNHISQTRAKLNTYLNAALIQIDNGHEPEIIAHFEKRANVLRNRIRELGDKDSGKCTFQTDLYGEINLDTPIVVK